MALRAPYARIACRIRVALGQTSLLYSCKESKRQDHSKILVVMQAILFDCSQPDHCYSLPCSLQKYATPASCQD